MTGVLLFVVVVASSSCMSKKTEELPKYQFYYYPNVNMYYDVAAGQYIYSLDSARTWNTINEISQEKPATLGNGVVLYSDQKQVWKQNEEHRVQHNGSMFNIPETKTKLASVEGEVKERKVARKPTVQQAEEPKKKGLAKFFNNLFGKKNKKDEQ